MSAQTEEEYLFEAAVKHAQDFLSGVLAHDPRFETRHMRWLTARASDSKAHFQALKQFLAEPVERGEPLPPDLQAWLVGYLRGDIHPPPGKAGRPKQTRETLAVSHAVDDVQRRFGLPTTRNDESPLCRSAADAVAEAMSRIGETPNTFKGVKEAYYTRYKKLIPYRSGVWEDDR